MCELNERISGFDFGQEDKPGRIDVKFVRETSTKIRQSASQIITLVRNFTLLIGDKIPQDDKNWQSFLVLLKICLIALSSAYSKETGAYLQILIEEKLWQIKELYPDLRIKPKMHYLVHYASQVEPLIHTWTMRHEAKLSFIKRSSRRGNFKNIALTVARHHQRWLCYQLNCEPTLLSVRSEVSTRCTESKFSTKPEHIQSELKIICPGLKENSVIRSPMWVKIQSAKYRLGVAVLLHWDEMDVKFGKVIEILQIIDANIVTFLLIVEVFEAEYLCSHYNSYVVTSSSTTQIVNVEMLHILTIRKSFDPSDLNLYISIPYMPC